MRTSACVGLGAGAVLGDRQQHGAAGREVLGRGGEHGGPLVPEPLCVWVAGDPAAARLGCAGQQDKYPQGIRRG